jgi:putative flippase GtrA
MHVIRFVISGGTATSINLGAVFMLTHFLGLWYVLSSITAFFAAFLVSFALQKFWTFGEDPTTYTHAQALLFLAVVLVALIINTTLIYSFVEYAHLHYLFAQFVSGIFIAVMNYFTYKHIVFRNGTLV